MRPSWFVLSLVAHGAALGTAAAIGAHALARQPRKAPEVMVQESVASRPAEPPVEALPPVAVEPCTEAPAPEPSAVREPIAEPPDPVLEPFASPTVPLTNTPLRPRTHAAAAAAPTVAPMPVPVEPPPPVVEPPAPPQAFVPASRCADNEPPEYPSTDRRLGHEGVVVVTAAIDAGGKVTAATLRTACPHPGLNRAALRAVQAWRFQAATERGVAVASELDVQVEFRLVGK